jgi:hypothetical protein
VNFGFFHGILYIYRAVCNAVGIPAIIGTNKCPLLTFTQGSHIGECTASLVAVEYLDVCVVERLLEWSDVGQILNWDIWMGQNRIL